MTVSYEDALQQVLESLRGGENLDAVIARFPEHEAALREDVRVSGLVTRLASAAPAPSAAARADAFRRMQAQMTTERGAGSSKPWWSFGSLGFARYAVAAAVVVLVVIGGALVLGRGGTPGVEAATIEGVVVDNGSGMLTVQTADALEQVSVPPGTQVSDTDGAPADLNGIEAGEVVVIDVQRTRHEVVAKRIQRRIETLETWCSDDSARCQGVVTGLEKAQAACEKSAAACLVATNRIEQVRSQVVDASEVNQLRLDCRNGDQAACREFVTFCRTHLVLCGATTPPEGSDAQPIRSRVAGLLRTCLQGDESACARLAGACEQYPNLCPVDSPLRPDGSATPESTPSSLVPQDASPGAPASDASTAGGESRPLVDRVREHIDSR